MSVLGTHLYQRTSWWCCKRLCSVSVNFFEDSTHLPLSWWVIYECSCHTMLRVQQSLTKYGMTPKMALPPPIHLISPWATGFFFVFPMKKVLKGTFADVEEVKPKNDRSTKRYQNQHVHKLFWAVEETSRWVYCIEWRVLWRWLEFNRVRINTQFLVNKVRFLGPPLHTKS